MFSERQLEDYICNNINDFVALLAEQLYCDKDHIRFLGRQVKLANWVCDLLYEVDVYSEPDKVRRYKDLIIVELKINPLTLSDLHQLCRYLSYACYLDDYINVHGFLVGPQMTDQVQDMQIFMSIFNDTHCIHFVEYKPMFTFESKDWELTDETKTNIARSKLVAVHKD